MAENSCRFGSQVIGYRNNAPLRALEPVVAAPATQLPDGIWTVQGRAIQGTRRCGDWLGSPDQIGKVSCPVWSKDEKEPIRGGPRASM